jgi:hypothetical protein
MVDGWRKFLKFQVYLLMATQRMQRWLRLKLWFSEYWLNALKQVKTNPCLSISNSLLHEPVAFDKVKTCFSCFVKHRLAN